MLFLVVQYPHGKCLDRMGCIRQLLQAFPHHRFGEATHFGRNILMIISYMYVYYFST